MCPPSHDVAPRTIGSGLRWIWGQRLALVIALALVLVFGTRACVEREGGPRPPHVVASIDRMAAFGDCDSDNAGDFYFDLGIEEVVYPARSPGASAGAHERRHPRARPARHRRARARLRPARRDLRRARADRLEPRSRARPSASRIGPYPEDELFTLRITLGVYENDPDGPQLGGPRRAPDDLVSR